MSIQIDENLLGIWFVSWPGGDWMAGAHRVPNGAEARYRFRTHRDSKAFGSQDENKWFDLKRPEGPPCTEEEVIEACAMLAKTVQEEQDGQKWELLRGAGSFEDFLEQFKALPFVHHRVLDERECHVSMKEQGVNVTVTVRHKSTGKKASVTGPAACKTQVRVAAFRKLANLLHG